MKALRPLAAVLILGMWATAARGDGGTMLLHQDSGAFTITLFAAPQPLQVGVADLSVMVQDRSSGEVLLDPAVDLTVAAESANASPQTVRLTRGQASNRLLQAAAIHFSSAGKWQLTLLVSRGGEAVRLGTECTVEPDHSRALLVWFYVLLPVGVILLFVIHQGLKIRPRKAR
jgi:FixH